jgi:protein TonB
MGEGFQAPRLSSRTCISDNLRLPAQLNGVAPESVTARIAVSATGEPAQVQVMGQVADPRISDAVKRAVQACEWVPGADAEGKPTSLWVVMPIRLTR